jgi:hypothetical protein
VPLAIGLTAVLAPVGLALVGIDFLDTRNLLPALPVLYVAAAIGLAAWRAPVGAALTGTLAVLCLVVVGAVEADARYQRVDWRDAGAAAGSAVGPKAIVVSPGSGLIPLQVYLPRLRTLSGAAAVRELDVIAVGAQVTGGGIGTPPRLSAPLPVPAGFRLVRAVAASTYTVLRYRAAAPVTVTPASLAGVHLGQTGSLALLEPAAAGKPGSSPQTP